MGNRTMSKQLELKFEDCFDEIKEKVEKVVRINKEKEEYTIHTEIVKVVEEYYNNNEIKDYNVNYFHEPWVFGRKIIFTLDIIEGPKAETKRLKITLRRFDCDTGILS